MSIREFGSLESEKDLAEYAHQVGIPRCRIEWSARSWSLVTDSGYPFEVGGASTEEKVVRDAHGAAMSHLMQEIARRRFLASLPEGTDFPENTLVSEKDPWFFLYRIEDNLGAIVKDPSGWWCSVRGLFHSRGLAPDLDAAIEQVRTLCSAQAIMRRWIRS